MQVRLKEIVKYSVQLKIIFGVHINTFSCKNGNKLLKTLEKRYEYNLFINNKKIDTEELKLKLNSILAKSTKEVKWLSPS